VADLQAGLVGGSKIVGSGPAAVLGAVGRSGLPIMSGPGFQDRRFGPRSSAGRGCRARYVDHEGGGRPVGSTPAKIVVSGRAAVPGAKGLVTDHR
jgi:hypothetical protein